LTCFYMEWDLPVHEPRGRCLTALPCFPALGVPREDRSLLEAGPRQ
jgi:hypothetical protein